MNCIVSMIFAEWLLFQELVYDFWQIVFTIRCVKNNVLSFLFSNSNCSYVNERESEVHRLIWFKLLFLNFIWQKSSDFNCYSLNQNCEYTDDVNTMQISSSVSHCRLVTVPQSSDWLERLPSPRPAFWERTYIVRVISYVGSIF